MKFGLLLVVFGCLFMITPDIIFRRKGPTDDSFTNMMQHLPLHKVLVVRNMVITGLFMFFFGLMSCSLGR